MRILAWFTVGCFMVLATASASPARVVKIETTAPLDDHSEGSIERAVAGAVETSVRGAVAMGLSRLVLEDARVMGAAVIIYLVATDDDQDDSAPGADVEPGAPEPNTPL